MSDLLSFGALCPLRRAVRLREAANKGVKFQTLKKCVFNFISFYMRINIYTLYGCLTRTHGCGFGCIRLYICSIYIFLSVKFVCMNASMWDSNQILQHVLMQWTCKTVNSSPPAAVSTQDTKRSPDNFSIKEMFYINEVPVKGQTARRQ